MSWQLPEETHFLRAINNIQELLWGVHDEGDWKDCGTKNATWETELPVLKRVRHPNIAYLHEVVLTNQKAYFILQLAAGGNLAPKIMSVYFLENADLEI